VARDGRPHLSRAQAVARAPLELDGVLAAVVLDLAPARSLEGRLPGEAPKLRAYMYLRSAKRRRTSARSAR
jgi:hypothetical protein